MIKSSTVSGGAGIAPPKTINDAMACGSTQRVTRLQVVSDGSYLIMPSLLAATSTLQLYDFSGTIVWSLQGVVIEGTADEWQGSMYLDGTSQTMFFHLIDTATSPNTNYLVSVDLTTGVPTTLGSFQNDNFVTPAPGNRQVGMTRENEGSGNFTVIVNNKVFVIDSTNGSLVSETPLILNGVTTASTHNGITGMLSPNGKYLVIGLLGGNNYALTSVKVLRVGSVTNEILIPFPADSIVGVASGAPTFRQWGNHILLGNMNTTAFTIRGSVLYDYDDFFRYLDKMQGY